MRASTGIKIHYTVIVLMFLTALSSFSFFHYFQDGRHLPYADSMARLNIARKVVDNLTPGLAQLGSVWLPLPQIFMLPFIWNKYLWQSGIAGSIMSSAAYIVGGVYLYRIAWLITGSFVSSLLTLAIYALNINVLYLSTTALSESIFMCALSACMYYLMMWVRTNNWKQLVPAGVAVSALTLIRYEGLPVLLASILLVFLYSIIRHRSVKKVQSDVLIFSFVACFGWILWTIYLTAIFGDPLFWMRYYAAPSVETTAVGEVKQVYTQAKPFLAAVWQYFTSVTWMSGIIPMGYAGLGLIILAYRSVKEKSWTFLPVMLPVSIYFMMALTLQRNTPIVQPDLTLSNILSPETSAQTGFNIRYGLMVFPWIVILSAYLFSLRKWGTHILLFSLFSVQVFTYFSPLYTSIFQIPYRLYGKPYTEVVEYMHKHYDSGLILVSASGFEDQMMQLGYDYKTYIHEGTNKYWKESLDHPARYAAWIILDFNHPTDRLGKELKDKPYWFWFYDKVLDTPNAKIYKIKTKPDLEIPGSNIYKPPPEVLNRVKKTAKDRYMEKMGPKKIMGFNAYDLAYLPKGEMEESVRLLKEHGVNVVRIWAFGEGNDGGFQPVAGQWNPARLDGLAYTLYILDKAGIKAIVTLSNYWKDYGGVPQYLAWDGLANREAAELDVFFTHNWSKSRYREHVERVITHKSPYTDKTLKEDPAILAWELMNEPRSSTKENGQIVVGWLTEMSGYVKHLDPNHLVFPGTEGFSDLYNAGEVGPSFDEVAAIESLDAATAHFYPEWNTKGFTLDEVLIDWADRAKTHSKPFIIEEIGFDKDNEENDGIDRVESVRDLFITAKALEMDGVLLWNWSLRRDDAYGISPRDPKDRDVLEIIQSALQE